MASHQFPHHLPVHQMLRPALGVVDRRRLRVDAQAVEEKEPKEQKEKPAKAKKETVPAAKEPAPAQKEMPPAAKEPAPAPAEEPKPKKRKWFGRKSDETK